MILQDVLESPHTETLIFATGRGAEVVPSPLLADTHSDMRDIAIRVLRDGVSMSPETEIGLCKALLELDAMLEKALSQLTEARQTAFQAEVLRGDALNVAVHQHAIAIQLREENQVLRLGGSPYLDLQWDDHDTVVQEMPYSCEGSR